jgi:hypothetical protein
VLRRADVLLIDETSAPGTERLAARLRRIGVRSVGAATPETARRLARCSDFVFRAVIVSACFTVAELALALEPLRTRLEAGSLCPIVTGEMPSAEARRVLREAGYDLTLWLPFDDATLRFQVNRSLVRAARRVEARHSLRAPFGRPADVLCSGRSKPARIYSLSASGAFLETPRPSPVGARLDVTLRLPRGPVTVPARVVHTNVTGNLRRDTAPLGMGVRFDATDPALRRALAALVVERMLPLSL